MFFPLRAPTADVSNAKYLAHLAYQTQKNLPLDVVYVPKLYHLCPYRCKFMSVPLQICNDTDTNAKPKYCFLFGFLSPLTSGLGFFSLFSHQTQLLPQQRKNKMTHSTSSNNKLQGKVAIITGGASGMGEATPIIAIVIAASISLIPLSFLVVGCFDCWWLVDFG